MPYTRDENMPPTRCFTKLICLRSKHSHPSAQKPSIRSCHGSHGLGLFFAPHRPRRRRPTTTNDAPGHLYGRQTLSPPPSSILVMAYQGSRFTSSLLPAVGAGASLFAIRVSSPAVVFLATLSLLSIKPLSPPPPSPVTPVVVESRVPRRTLILVLLSLSSLSFLIDGLAYVAGAVFNKAWTLGTGIPLASLLGLVAYAGLAALGAWKDINNIQVWSFNRVRLAITFALALDIAQVVLLAPSVKTRGMYTAWHYGPY